MLIQELERQDRI